MLVWRQPWIGGYCRRSAALRGGLCATDINTLSSTSVCYAVYSARARHRDRTSDLLRLFGAVTRSRLLATLDSLRVQYAANDRVSHARQVVRAAAADQHDRVFLKIVSLARNVGNG